MYHIQFKIQFIKIIHKNNQYETEYKIQQLVLKFDETIFRVAKKPEKNLKFDILGKKKKGILET